MAKAKGMSMCAMDKEYRAQDDLRALRQAEEIRTDKSRLSAAQKLATKEVQALQRVGKPPAAKPSTVRRKK
jgi:hypothetical protein